jgi:hypothetical protein
MRQNEFGWGPRGEFHFGGRRGGGFGGFGRGFGPFGPGGRGGGGMGKLFRAGKLLADGDLRLIALALLAGGRGTATTSSRRWRSGATASTARAPASSIRR